MTKYYTMLTILFIVCSGCQKVGTDPQNTDNKLKSKSQNAAMASHQTNSLKPENRSESVPESSSAMMSADFIITDALLKDRPTFEALDEAPSTTSFCLGDNVAIANGSKKTVGLTDTPAGSDNTSTLGLVQPGKVYRYQPTELGTFNIGDVDDTMPLFQFEVTKC